MSSNLIFPYSKPSSLHVSNFLLPEITRISEHALQKICLSTKYAIAEAEIENVQIHEYVRVRTCTFAIIANAVLPCTERTRTEEK